VTSTTTTPTRAAAALPPEVGHVLSAYPEGVRERGRAALGALLAERLGEADPQAWRGSSLTGDGFPLEVAFATSDARLRLTVEVGRRGAGPDGRLATSARRLADVTGVAVPEQVLDRMLALQRGAAALRYGAWVSCRVSPGGLAGKLYAEVPDPRWRWPGLPEPRPDGREVAARMVACTPATGEIEAYFRVPSMQPGHLVGVLAPIGLSALASRLRAAVELLYGHRLDGRLPGPSVGVSYTVGPRSRVTLHFYARALWGGDGWVRQRFAAAARALDADPTAYLAVTQPLDGAASWATRHGIVGLTLSPTEAPTLTIGLRPVAP